MTAEQIYNKYFDIGYDDAISGKSRLETDMSEEEQHAYNDGFFEGIEDNEKESKEAKRKRWL